MKTTEFQIDLHLDEAQLFLTMKEDVREGLNLRPKEIPPKYFYDQIGSELFEEITLLPEYYQTRTERRLLLDIAEDIVHRNSFDELLELGSGSSEKTRVILDAMRDARGLRRYIPFDVSESMVKQTAEKLVLEYPDMELHGVIGDFTVHLEEVPSSAHRLTAFLGGTIGNFHREDAVAFLSEIGKTMQPGDRLLLGTDLIKDIDELEAAYNDSAGVTAEFNRNILKVMNKRLGADFETDAFEHVAFYNRVEQQIEMWLHSLEKQTVEFEALEMKVEIEQSERIRTEISRKYDRESVGKMLATAGLEMTEWHTDPDDKFALSLSRRNGVR